MLRGLRRHGVKAVHAVCPIVYPSFPRSCTLFVRATRCTLEPAFTVDVPAFINFGAIRVLTQAVSVSMRLLRLGRRYGRPRAILTYNLNPGYVLAGYIVGRLWRVPLAPVAADLNPPDAAAARAEGAGRPVAGGVAAPGRRRRNLLVSHNARLRIAAASNKGRARRRCY